MSIIEVKNISKKYTLSHQNEKYLTLRDKIGGFISHPIKTARELKKLKREEFWALRDVSFNVEQGEVVGIIGANGAGKSTLLKILSQITPPTSGEIKIKGKVASLLEVGTGFHPELTGRENIFLNGAILGMAKKEIEKKFNEIVEFSGIEKFLDTPVKRYSSGMYVRLAFSVAAHMEPDILLIDEVLAVGDAEFQKKCLGKMEEVTSKAGRTILFVSHNLAAVRNICRQCLLIEKGKLKFFEKTENVLEKYLNFNYLTRSDYEYVPVRDKMIQILKITILDNNNKPNHLVNVNDVFYIEVQYILKKDINKKNLVFLRFYDSKNNVLLLTFDIDTNEKFYISREKGEYCSIFKFPPGIFNQQKCKVTVGCGILPKYNNNSDKNDFFDEKEIFFEFISNSQNFSSKFFSGKRGGSFLLKIPCEIKKK